MDQLVNATRIRRAEQIRSATAQRWGAILGGSALAVYGISRRSKAGAALAAVGGLLAFGGARMNSRAREVHAEATFTVNCSPEEAYRFWRNFEDLPRFMTHLEAVKVISERRSEWSARGPFGVQLRWKAEIVDERPNEWIVWRTLPGSNIENKGSVYFHPAPGNRGTEVTVAMQYRPIAGALGKAVAALMGRSPQFTIREELRHFKQLIEAGEIPTTYGQPHGRRSAVVGIVHRIYEDLRPKPVSRAQVPGLAVRERAS